MIRALAPALAALLITLSGCSGGAEPAAPASEAAKPGISVSNARLVLPAVRGNPGAAYFELANGTDRAVVLTGIGIAGSERTEIHETKGTTMAPVPEVAVAPGDRASFAPGGRHVMVLGAPPGSAAGESRAMTLTFKDGASQRVEVRLERLGTDPMGDMHHDGAAH